MPLPPETVTWAYRLFLDREPESSQVVEELASRVEDTRQLRQAFTECAEFRQSHAVTNPPVLNGTEPPLEIDVRTSPEELEALLAHVHRTWQHLGETEPHYSVLTVDRFSASSIDQTEEAFYATGRRNVDILLETLRRVGVDPSRLSRCLEFGCGVGRLTRYLAEEFEHVIGYDISRSHLEIAAKHLDDCDLDNVDLKQIRELADLKKLPASDLVYSVIVLQHNPPPIMAQLIDGLLGAVAPGGIAYFQLPTYRKGYRFSLKKYLDRTKTARPAMEMHVLPQRRVFELIADHGATVLEVLEDNWTGARDVEVSNTFIVRKPD